MEFTNFYERNIQEHTEFCFVLFLKLNSITSMCGPPLKKTFMVWSGLAYQMDQQHHNLQRCQLGQDTADNTERGSKVRCSKSARVRQELYITRCGLPYCETKGSMLSGNHESGMEQYLCIRNSLCWRMCCCAQAETVVLCVWCRLKQQLNFSWSHQKKGT